ncbi:hypothetical protein M427DRAFT_489053 [Gonapodya prolifera JEL478]|uniref:Uncharacterized protein n=1 Tax=Gonapodya prolifera (strain JEL478) TaxID=1344416 RepID=A0A138ZZ87_GONPJ|nr:hypothetical protein M427DRAFT_489053 [Gonapodya prolifera JEL478]|eukprot:KXS09819.1 hypothetical protein M427DRAFT_489053 [Gonapodya prolifera JEL478]
MSGKAVSSGELLKVVRDITGTNVQSLEFRDFAEGSYWKYFDATYPRFIGLIQGRTNDLPVLPWEHIPNRAAKANVMQLAKASVTEGAKEANEHLAKLLNMRRDVMPAHVHNAGIIAGREFNVAIAYPAYHALPASITGTPGRNTTSLNALKQAPVPVLDYLLKLYDLYSADIAQESQEKTLEEVRLFSRTCGPNGSFDG